MKKIVLVFVLVFVFLQQNCMAQKATVVVTNTERVQRQEVVAVDAKQVSDLLNLGWGDKLVVKNALNQEVAYQLSYDGKILIDASVRPCGTAEFTITKGEPKEMKAFVKGSYHPERVDDIAWENDRTAYRLYGPALQASGERAFGNDVWVKNTPDLEVEKRYSVEHAAAGMIKELKKQGKNDEAFDLEVATTYHFDHGYGLDCYKVGPSLGCGTPALLVDGQIKFPYCYKEYKILDNGPLRFTVELTYNPEVVGKEKDIVEHRILSLDKGSNFNKMVVWYDGFKKPFKVCAGVVVHAEDVESAVVGKGYVQYADPTDHPSKQNFQIYTAAVFPEDGVETQFLKAEKVENGIAGHLIGSKKIKPGEKFTYYFGSAWSKYDVRNQNEWQCRINTFIDEIHAPLQVMVK